MSGAVILAAAGLAASLGSSAQAQEAESAQLRSSPAAASAATSADAGVQIEEVLVTAQKRETSLQTTPIAVTAISGETLQEKQVRSIADLTSLVPTLKFATAESAAHVTIRGVGNVSTNIGDQIPVAVNFNEVFIGRPSQLVGGMFDVASLEALLGPQGTLYGRNATAGAINITTGRPTDALSGFGRVSVGNYNSLNVEGAVSGPIVGDKLLARVAGFVDRHDGYGRNLLTGGQVDDRNAWGVRGTVEFNPSDSIKLTGIAEYFSQHDNSGGQHFFGFGPELPGAYPNPAARYAYPYLATPASDVRDLTNFTDPRFKLHYVALTGIAEWDLGGPISLRSITGYRDGKSSNINQIGGPAPNLYIVSVEPAHQFSQELQLHYDTSRLHGTVGAYYFYEDDNAIQDVVASQRVINFLSGNPTIPPPNTWTDRQELGGEQYTRAYALFGEVSWKLTDKLSLIGGLRYSAEKKELTSYYPANGVTVPVSVVFDPADPFHSVAPRPPAIHYPQVTFKSTTPKVGLQYEFTPDVMGYVTYTKGFKAGGYNVNRPIPPGGVYQPERITDIEAGIKTTALDRKLRTNISLFHYDYTNLQVTQVVGTAVVIQNAATAEVYGGEADVTFRPDEHWDFRFSGSYLHTEYTDYVGSSSLFYRASAFPAIFGPGGNVSYTGNRLNNAPKLTGHWEVAYHIPLQTGRVTLRGEAEYSSKFYFTPDNFPTIAQGAYLKENGYVTYRSDHGWTATAFIRNISNKTTRTSTLITSPTVAQALTGTLAPPRTFGAELRWDF